MTNHRSSSSSSKQVVRAAGLLLLSMQEQQRSRLGRQQQDGCMCRTVLRLMLALCRSHPQPHLPLLLFLMAVLTAVLQMVLLGLRVRKCLQVASLQRPVVRLWDQARKAALHSTVLGKESSSSSRVLMSSSSSSSHLMLACNPQQHRWLPSLLLLLLTARMPQQLLLRRQHQPRIQQAARARCRFWPLPGCSCRPGTARSFLRLLLPTAPAQSSLLSQMTWCLHSDSMLSSKQPRCCSRSSRQRAHRQSSSSRRTKS